MSHETNTRTTTPHRSGAGLYIILTVTAAITAAVAAQTTLLLSLPPWAMFMGWVAYFTRRPSAQEGLQSWVCVVIGLCIGALAVTATGLLAPTLGALAFPTVVLCVALTVISTRGLPVLGNLLGYFLGLITFFASHFEPEVASIARLASATAIGSAAGWMVQFLEKKVRSIAAA